MSFDKLRRKTEIVFGKLGQCTSCRIVKQHILSRLTKNKPTSSHYELVYSDPQAGVDTGTLECDVITLTINKIICTEMLHGLISD